MKSRLIILLFMITAAWLLSACMGLIPLVKQTDSDEYLAPVLSESLAETVDLPGSDNTSDLSTDVEIYYKTMVYIEGTAQLMTKFDWGSMTEDNQGVIVSMMAIPGFMDNRIFATQQTSLPAELTSPWKISLQARDQILASLEALLMISLTQEEFSNQIEASLTLATAAVAETEEIMRSSHDASEDMITIAKRAALTEMGEDFQSIASFFLTAQSQGEEKSD